MSSAESFPDEACAQGVGADVCRVHPRGREATLDDIVYDVPAHLVRLYVTASENGAQDRTWRS